jgi:hypothetical protein
MLLASALLNQKAKQNLTGRKGLQLPSWCQHIRSRGLVTLFWRVCKHFWQLWQHRIVFLFVTVLAYKLASSQLYPLDLEPKTRPTSRLVFHLPFSKTFNLIVYRSEPLPPCKYEPCECFQGLCVLDKICS